MFFPGKIVTRVFQFTLRNNLGKSKIRRISSVVFSKSPYRVNSIEGVYRAFVAGKFHVNNTITQVRAMGALSPLDPSSYARPELAVIKHISLSLNVDFNEKVISAVATYSLDVLQNLTEVILDTSNLTIKSIETVDGQPLQFKFGEEIPNFGSKLTITLSQAAFAEEQALPEQPCKECVPIPAALDDITLNYNGFVYEPELVGVSDEERKNYIADHDTKPCSCFYVTDTKSRASRGNRVTLESSHASYPASSPKSAKHKCCDDGYITVIGTDGIPHRITTIDELTTYGGIPPKDVKGRKVVPPQKPGGAPSKPDGVPPWENENVSPSILDGVLPTWLQAIIKPSKKLTNVRLSDMGNSKKVKFVIKYSTAPTASGLQWLDPNQTSGKKHPYLFSQLQPIHARSILPCQDTPAVKFTYDAEVTAPAEFTVLMSALRGEVKGNKTSFNQPMPLPSYLVAIAVGVLQSKNLGPRSRVWAETEELDRSAWEFAETEHYLKAAEKLCGPYEWTEYDLLVLPPSFPYGGMENPCLTFVTPTLLAGDRSQADVIVHEIMHSWTGNLVTNRNFEHFWLNEGFTVYLERKVGASLIEDPEEAKRSRDFHSILGLQELTETIQTLGPNSGLTQLVPDLKSVHPDDAFSRVPYEKGSLFLRYLEDLVGGPEVFDDFLRSYLRNYSKKSLDTNDFKKYLLTYFNATNKLDEVNWDAWLYTPGMPPVIPAYDTNMTRSVTNLVKSIVESDATFAWKDVKSFTPHQMIYLLQALLEKDPLPLPALHSLGKEYKVQDNKNTEIRYRWLRLCISSQDVTKLDEVFEFLNSQGRMKYVRPIYRDLYAWKQVRERTIVNFLSNEKYMMHVSAYTLRKDLHLND